MDTSSLIVLVVVGIVLLGAPGVVLRSAGSAGDLLAALFVPPDQTLRWPHGVQESDAPWGWRPAVQTAELDVVGVVTDVDRPALDIDAVLAAPSPGHTAYVERLHPVGPIRFRARPQ
jgi:hypothetical protein